ncbi:MAG: LysR family transcriptional regulator [Pseudomonadota bacterium]
MNWQAISFDWNQVRAFLATAEEGSLSAAARALGSTQPTLSRQVSGLEQELGVTLFERGHRAMVLTGAGLELLEHVRVMGEAATRISLAASGQAQAIEGKVTLTATEFFANYHLPSIVARTRARYRD